MRSIDICIYTVTLQKSGKKSRWLPLLPNVPIDIPCTYTLFIYYQEIFQRNHHKFVKERKYFGNNLGIDRRSAKEHGRYKGINWYEASLSFGSNLGNTGRKDKEYDK